MWRVLAGAGPPPASRPHADPRRGAAAGGAACVAPRRLASRRVASRCLRSNHPISERKLGKELESRDPLAPSPFLATSRLALSAPRGWGWGGRRERGSEAIRPFAPRGPRSPRSPRPRPRKQAKGESRQAGKRCLPVGAFLCAAGRAGRSPRCCLPPLVGSFFNFFGKKIFPLLHWLQGHRGIAPPHRRVPRCTPRPCRT